MNENTNDHDIKKVYSNYNSVSDLQKFVIGNEEGEDEDMENELENLEEFKG